MDTQPIVGAPVTGSRTLPRDVFLYLLVIVVLSMSAGSLVALLITLINRYLPDPALNMCAYDACAPSIRWAVAVLVIAFPVLVWAWHFIRKDIAADPTKAELRVRKWLLYFTLFVAGVTVIGDFISLVYNWLQGELTLQFGLKIIAVLLVAGTIFYYFLKELHGGKRQRLIAALSIVFVVLAISVGFWTAGLPTSARDQRLDQQRVSDLQAVQNEIVNYWTSKQKLPGSLDDLRNSISGFVPPMDPETNQPYEYLTTGTLKFQLCAVFKTVSSTSPAVHPVGPYGNPMGETWDHGIGRVCFDRQIDPQLYPPKQSVQ